MHYRLFVTYSRSFRIEGHSSFGLGISSFTLTTLWPVVKRHQRECTADAKELWSGEPQRPKGAADILPGRSCFKLRPLEDTHLKTGRGLRPNDRRAASALWYSSFSPFHSSTPVSMPSYRVVQGDLDRAVGRHGDGAFQGTEQSLRISRCRRVRKRMRPHSRSSRNGEQT